MKENKDKRKLKWSKPSFSKLPFRSTLGGDFSWTEEDVWYQS